jgi:hypothetical protein
MLSGYTSMTEMEELIEIYINELSEQEKLVLDIAKDHLGSSFVIEKSIGFIEWLQKYQNE